MKERKSMCLKNNGPTTIAQKCSYGAGGELIGGKAANRH